MRVRGRKLEKRKAVEENKTEKREKYEKVVSEPARNEDSRKPG